MENNLTKGNVLKTLIYFSLPFLLSYFMQTLYGMADLYIIGQYYGTASTTAVSIGSQIMHMITVMIVGLAMGTTVLIGQAVGAKKSEDISTVIGNTITLYMGIAVVLMIVVLMCINPIVNIMSTPSEAIAGTKLYLTICFIGIPFITAYNLISSIFRGLGDSKSPMYFIAIACVANIVFDYIFIGYFHLDTAGAALGTTLAQTLSVIVSLLMIMKRKMIHLSLSDLKIQSKTVKDLLSIGVPVACQDGFIQVSFLVITIIANRRGLDVAAAVGIVEKMISFMFLVPSSMLSSVSALAAQNVGANEHIRASKTLQYACTIAVSWGLLMVIVMHFFSYPLIGMFSDSESVVTLACQYMSGYVWDCVFAGIHFSFSGYFCAYNLSLISFIHNSISIICVRIPFAYLSAIYFPSTLLPMGLASASGSLISVLICIGVFIYMKRKGKLNGQVV
ncbi:MAG: MATE family efflux transporter [Erysipelotrichaceae bacterium]|nr:MATE family efflux transporter [Erysipelotrichaceae bacterium]